MAYDEVLAQRVRQSLARRKGIAEKKMFGGVGFLLNGNLCVGIWKDALIVRLAAEEAEEALKEPHVRAFNVSGRPMKGWLLVGPESLENEDRLRDWIGRALKFVGKLPAK